MREAFLIQMNEFDLQLESDLRQLLNPIVAAPPPARRGAGIGRYLYVLLLLALLPLALALACAQAKTRESNKKWSDGVVVASNMCARDGSVQLPNEVLEAARTLAAGKPHFLYNRELDALKQLDPHGAIGDLRNPGNGFGIRRLHHGADPHLGGKPVGVERCLGEESDDVERGRAGSFDQLTQLLHDR